MKHPLWFRLVHTWCSNGRTGLTLPFLVGADARARDGIASSADVRRILAEMLSYRDPRCSLIILWCPNRGAPVLGVHGVGGLRLMIADSLKEKWGKNEEKIVEELIQVSERVIRQGHFSRIGDAPNAEWSSFDRSDLEFIDSLIGEKTGSQSKVSTADRSAAVTDFKR